MIKEFNELLGKTLSNVENLEDKELLFVLDSGEKYHLYHDQDCCESVMIEDIIGELEDLVGSPIVMAEEVSERGEDNSGYGTETWTFYKLATIKGYVTIRWLGSSNGYYSESVSFGSV